MTNDTTQPREQASSPLEALAVITNRLALTYRICCGTSPKQSVGELLDVTINMPEWEVVRAALASPAVATASANGERPACPHCRTHEVSLARTCHNSACSGYAREETIYEGWRTPAPIQEAALEALYNSLPDILPNGAYQRFLNSGKWSTGNSYALRGIVASLEYRADDMEIVYAAMDEANAAITRQAAPEAPKGWKVVPTFSTAEMDRAGFAALNGGHVEIDAAHCYKAMIGAAPEAPDSEQQALFDDLESAIAGWGGGLVDKIEAVIQKYRPTADCGACPGDGSICKVECRLRSESPPAATTASASTNTTPFQCRTRWHNIPPCADCVEVGYCIGGKLADERRAPAPSRNAAPFPKPEQWAYNTLTERMETRKSGGYYLASEADRWAAALTQQSTAQAPTPGVSALRDVRAEVREMQNNLETFGPYSEEAARVAIDGVLDLIDDHIAAMSAATEKEPK